MFAIFIHAETSSLSSLSSGHIGLQAFHHILTDPRVQNIPLVLETPSFEKPEVWGKEVEVLNRLSSTHGNEEKLEWEAMVEEIKAVVEEASGGTAKTQKKGKAAPKTAAKKRGKKVVETDEEDDE
jgi:AP endonuclease 1